MTRSKLQAVSLILALALGTLARGQVLRLETFQRVMQVERSPDRLTVSFLCPEIFSDRFKRRLSSGFRQTIVVHLQLSDQTGKTLVAHATARYTILYDIWEEIFKVAIEGAGARQVLTLRSMDDLVERLGAIRNLPLISLQDVSDKERYRLVARIVINPTSPELRKKVRDFISNPDGRSAIGEPRSSLIKRYTPFFVDENKIQADAVLTYRSQLITIPRPKGGG